MKNESNQPRSTKNIIALGVLLAASVLWGYFSSVQSGAELDRPIPARELDPAFLSIDGIRPGLSRKEVAGLTGSSSQDSPGFLESGSLCVVFEDDRVSRVTGDCLQYKGLKLISKDSPQARWMGILGGPGSVERDPGCGYSPRYASQHHYPELGLVVGASGEKGWLKDGPATAHGFTLARSK